VGNTWLCDKGGWITKPALWTWFSAAVVMSSVITGLLSSIKRFFFLTFFGMVEIFRLDSTQFPRHLMHFDNGYRAFMAVALLAHRHRSPVLAMAREIKFGTVPLAQHNIRGRGGGGGGGGESGGGEGGGESGGESGGGRQLPRTQSGQQLARAMMGISIRRREEQDDQQAGQDVESGGVTAQPQPQGSAGGGTQGGGERSASERAAEQRQALIRAKRARTRWHLARTLLNNPGLVAERADAREAAAAAAAARAAAEAKGESSMAEMVHDAMAVALGLE